MELAVNDYVAHSLQQGQKESTIRKHFNEFSQAQFSDPQKAEWRYFSKHLNNRLNIPPAAVEMVANFKILCPSYNDVTRLQKKEGILEYVKAYDKRGEPKKNTLTRIVNIVNFVNKEHIKSTGILRPADLEFLNKIKIEANFMLSNIVKKEEGFKKYVNPNTVSELLVDIKKYTSDYAMPDKNALSEFATYYALKGYSQSIDSAKGRNAGEGLLIFLSKQTNQLESFINEAQKKFGSQSAEFNKINEFAKCYVSELKTMVNSHIAQVDIEIKNAANLEGVMLTNLKKQKVKFLETINSLPFLKQTKNTNSIPNDSSKGRSTLKP